MGVGHVEDFKGSGQMGPGRIEVSGAGKRDCEYLLVFVYIAG